MTKIYDFGQHFSPSPIIGTRSGRGEGYCSPRWLGNTQLDPWGYLKQLDCGKQETWLK